MWSITWNPLKLARAGIEKAIDSLSDVKPAPPLDTTYRAPTAVPVDNASQAPAGDRGADGTIYANGEPVSGRFIDDQAQQSDPTAQAARRTEQFARTVNSFDEDKQTLLAQVVSKFFTAMAYLVPLGIGYFAGAALG